MGSIRQWRVPLHRDRNHEIVMNLSKRFPINGPAGTMFESTVQQTRFYLPAHLGGAPVDLTKLSLHDAAELYKAGWEVLVKKEIDEPKEKERPDSSTKKTTKK